MKVYRIHIRPKGGLGKSEYSFKYCLDENVLGVGWQINSTVSGISWEEYLHQYMLQKDAKKSDISRAAYIKNNIKEDDLVWTRDTKGHYYLAKVLSGWEYYTNPSARDADIVNIFRVDIKKVDSIDDVPGKVVASFRASRTIQSIHDSNVNNYSKYLWNILSNSDHYNLEGLDISNIFSFIDSEETEDVFSIYLQMKDWLIIPNSRKRDTMKIEFYLINRTTKERAVVQVKTGNTPINTKNWQGRNEIVYLFQSNGIYHGEDYSRVERIKPKEIENFIYTNLHLMPSSIQRRVEIIKNINAN